MLMLVLLARPLLSHPVEIDDDVDAEDEEMGT